MFRNNASGGEEGISTFEKVWAHCKNWGGYRKLT